MKKLLLTPSQTVGPFLHIGLVWPDAADVVPAGTPGEVQVRGTVYDGHGAPVVDALVETWQADANGHFDHPLDLAGSDFRGFGRCPTGARGEWAIRTLKPAGVPARDGAPQAPHIDVSVFARGLLDRVVTRLYFDDEPVANAADPVLATVPHGRRATLLARRSDDAYVFDIRLQGEAETVFFDL